MKDNLKSIPNAANSYLEYTPSTCVKEEHFVCVCEGSGGLGGGCGLNSSNINFTASLYDYNCFYGV